MNYSLRRIGFSLITSLCFFGTGQAATVSAPESVTFGLHFSSLDVSLNDPKQQPVDTTVEQVGIASFDTGEQTLQPGLLLGYAHVGNINQLLAAGLQPQGFYIGPALRGMLIDNGRLSAALTGTYLYQRVRDSNADRELTLEWQQPQLDLDMLWRFSQRVALSLAGQYGRIDVNERIKGTVNQTLTLDSGPTLGYRAGLEFDLGEDGQVGILLHRAIGDGVELYFQQQF